MIPPWRRSAVVVLALLAVAWLPSCGGDDDGATPSTAAATAVDVRPFEEVQASAMRFEADPSDPSRAIFRVTTIEPMICAIVWGEDDSFGRFNNSLAMNGTGIAQHDVVLPDVEGGVTYRYVVQGTTADGTLYRSPVGSFRIDAPAPAATTADPGPDLAVGATVDASSEYSADFAATNAVDGDTATEWATAGDGNGGWITVDLGSEQALAGVAFLTRSMADGTAVTQTFTVTVDDGQPIGPFSAGTVADQRVAALSGTGRRLRFDVDASSGGNVGAVEVRVFGPPP